MYEIYILKNTGWVWFAECKNINEVDNIVWKLINLRPNKGIQIIQDEFELCYINGSEEQYWWFKCKYVRDKKNGYDYIKSYHKSSKEN